VASNGRRDGHATPHEDIVKPNATKAGEAAPTLRLKAVSAGRIPASPSVRLYAELGLIDGQRDSNGNWLFSEKAPDQVRRVRPNG